jgi:hypothetical protein
LPLWQSALKRKPSWSRRNGLAGGRNDAGNPRPLSRRLPLQARKNRLASAAGKQDDSGVHHATAANGKLDASAGPALRQGGKRREQQAAS